MVALAVHRAGSASAAMAAGTLAAADGTDGKEKSGRYRNEQNPIIEIHKIPFSNRESFKKLY